MKFAEKEANDRLRTIIDMVDRAIVSEAMLSETERLLRRILSVANGTEDELPADPRQKPLDHMIISCDASMRGNPGGVAAVAAVIQFPTNAKAQVPEKYHQPSAAKTNNEAEYEAIYFALTTLLARHNNPMAVIEIRSDSRLVIGQLNKEMECNEPRLQKMRDAIAELVNTLPTPTFFTWWPRCSTPELKLANDLAQSVTEELESKRKANAQEGSKVS